MSAIDLRSRRRAAAVVVALTLLACGDDPMRIRPVPVTGEMSLFTILEPDRGTQAVQVQQSPSTIDIGLRATIDSAGIPLSSDTAAVHIFDALCTRRYGGVNLEEEGWIMGCVTVPLRPRFGVTYRVQVTAAGRPTVSGTTTVPGDFQVLSRSIEPVAGGMKVNAAWSRSSGAYRYVVMLDGDPGEQCAAPGSCERWMAVVDDTTISVTIDQRLLEHSFPEYSFAVFAVSRELLGYLTTGSTSGYFPVPPAQNVTGGTGAVGAWVRRSVTQIMGVDVQRIAGGVQLVHRGAAPVRFTLLDAEGGGARYYCSQYEEYCLDMAPGDSIVVPYENIQRANANTEEIHVEACRPTPPIDCSYRILRY